MPRKNPIPERERAICFRLREVRKEFLGLSQAMAARRVGIDSVRLASYEHARVPLRFAFVDAFCERFKVSLKYIAEGVTTPADYLPVAPTLRAAIPPSSLLSQAYYDHLRPAWGEDEKFGWFEWCAIMHKDATGKGPAPSLPLSCPPETFLDYVIAILREDFAQSPHALKADLLARVLKALSRFKLDNLDAVKGSRPGAEHPWERYARAEARKKLLTPLTAERNLAAMSEMQALIRRLQSVTRSPGKKTELAKALGVPRPRVSEWLRKVKPIVPSGESTLNLLKWVEQEEGQQKTADDVRPIISGKSTQRRKVKCEIYKPTPSQAPK